MQLLNPMRLPTSLTSRQRSSLLAVTIMVVAYVVLLAPLVGRYEEKAFRLCLVPIGVASFVFGYRGLSVAVFINAFNLWFIRYSGRAPASLAPDLAISGAVTSFLVAFAISALGETTRKVKELNQELKELSLIDPLTRLHNRRFASEVVATMAATFLIKKTEEEVKKRNTNLESKVMGIFVLDIDHFKRINDNFGHGAGDKVLVATSELLMKSVRFDDVVIRWGGEEFLVVLVDTDLAYLPQFARKIREAVEGNRVVLEADHTISVTVSVGCVHYPLSRRSRNQTGACYTGDT